MDGIYDSSCTINLTFSLLLTTRGNSLKFDVTKYCSAAAPAAVGRVLVATFRFLAGY